MRNKNRKAALLLAASMILSFAACGEETPAQPSLPVESAALTESQPDEDPDVGEHKDYDQLEGKVTESGEILVADIDGRKTGFVPFVAVSPEGHMEFYANELNEIKELVGAKVNVYSMIVPSACELYCPKNERYRIDSQEEIISGIKELLVDVQQIDVLPTLGNHNAEEIYYRTDSRWTPLGAYYAGKVFAKAAGVDYADISEYTKTSPKEYVGNYSEMCGPEAYENFKKQPDSFSFYEPKAAYAVNYYDEQFDFLSTDKFYSEAEGSLYDGYYKGGDNCLRIDTKVTNGRKLLLVKDRMGTCMPTFFTSSFTRIYVVSMDYLEANLTEMIKDFGITDVLYLTSIFNVAGDNVYMLETLRTQATHGTLDDAAPSDALDAVKSTDSDTDTEDTDEDESGEEYYYDPGYYGYYGYDGADYTESTADAGGADGYDYGGDQDGEDYGYDDGGEEYDDGGDDYYEDE